MAAITRVVEIRVDIIAVVRIIVLGVNTVNHNNGYAQQGNKATHFSCCWLSQFSFIEIQRLAQLLLDIH